MQSTIKIFNFLCSQRAFLLLKVAIKNYLLRILKKTQTLEIILAKSEWLRSTDSNILLRNFLLEYSKRKVFMLSLLKAPKGLGNKGTKKNCRKEQGNINLL